jgi:hypothetical protein
MIHFKHRL